MISYNILTSNLYKDWSIEMEVTVTDTSLTFTEHLYNTDLNVRITARTLSVNDIPAFETAARTPIKELKTFLEDKRSKDNLNVEHLQRLCERHGIRYGLTGDRPATAHRKYIKQMRDTHYARQHKGFLLCERAQNNVRGNMPGTPRNTDKAISLFQEAIGHGYCPAYSLLAKLLLDEGCEEDAVRILEKGVKSGDADSMILLAQMLSRQSAPDYKRAAKLYIAASEKGYCKKAASGLHQLIGEGHFTPGADLYMKLIGIAGRSDFLLKDAIANHPLLDPDLVRPRNLLFEDNSDIHAAREMLISALEKGKTMAYGGLAKCDLLERRWGRAAENVMKGIEAGDTGTCLIYAARLALMGADFVNFTDELGRPDYDGALKWALRCIDEDQRFGFQMLCHLANLGAVTMKDIIIPELKARYDHFIGNIPEKKRADIYCEPFDGKR